MPNCLPSAEVSVRHFGTSADMSGQFGTNAEVSYGHFGTSAEMSWVGSVLGPKCLDTLPHKESTR